MLKITMMKRIAFFFYGIFSYALFLFTFLYAFGFVGNLFVPKSIDGTPQLSFLSALSINSLLLLIFSFQHSVMARKSFKRWITRTIPEPLERSTYVLLSSLCLLILMWQWQPMGGIIWEINHPFFNGVITTLFIGGWMLVLFSTFLINHFDLFGLRQVWFYLKNEPYQPLRFRTPLVYQIVRHPLYLGWLIGFWATPLMTAAHFFFALVTTIYILTAIRFEERDLTEHFGTLYKTYKNNVPMILPFFRKKRISG